ncbi:MAG: BBP7 family outer membrane beta-barrel protein [Gemmataceae bacterium]|nr:BBP7 family outer membrane beta-barrel protein [Gemmataceae bacterium]
MKKLAISSLAVALWLQGSAEAQSPFFQPAANQPWAQQPWAQQPWAQPAVQPAGQPIQLVASRPAPMPPGGMVPVRVHFGGALTRDGVVPVPVYLNQSAAFPASVASGRTPAAGSVTRVQHETLKEPTRKASPPAGESKDAPNPSTISVYHGAPEICDPRFVAPDVDDLRRPHPAPCGYRWYIAGEYLHWWVRPIDSPALLLVDGAPVTASDVDAFDRQGARFTIGRWLPNPHGLWGLEGTIMFTGLRRARNTYQSNGVQLLEHPFIDAGTGAPDSLPVAIDPPALDPREGLTEIEAASRMFGFEVNFRRELCRTSCGHLDLLFGYRQFHLDEAIAVRDRVIYDTAPIPLSDATVIGVDEFGTHNRIFAGQIGLDGEVNWRRLYVGAWGKFAVGGNDEVINVSGWTVVQPTPGRLPPPPQTNGKSFAGSVYTQASNIGSFSDSQLTVLPEVGVNVGYKITDNWRLGAGYNFLYINNVVRPGDAIDTTISRTQIPQLQPLAPAPGPRPAPPSFIESAYWAHGLTVHMEIRY